MAERNEQPTHEEVNEQLSRMLSSKRFRRAPRQAQFLSLVVERKLNGKKTPGVVIAKALFAQTFKKDESSIVRVTARSLRNALSDYFEMEGSDDPVRITLLAPPPEKAVKRSRGEAYTPQFDYSPSHPVHLQYKAALVLVATGTIASLKQSIEIFARVLDVRPEHLGAAIGMADAWCRVVSWTQHKAKRAYLEKTSFEALTMLLMAIQREPKDWKIHAVLGHLCLAMAVGGDELRRAKEAFDKALSLNRARTEDFPPYLLFLVRSGQIALELKLARRLLESRMGDTNAYIAYSDIHLAAGNVEEASNSLELALQVNGPNGTVHQRLYFIRMLQGRFDEATVHFD